MEITRLEVGLTKRNDFAGVEVEVQRVSWDGEDMPFRSGFVAAIEWLLTQVELPYFPATAWVEVYTPKVSRRGELSDQVDDAESVAGRLWSFVVAAAQGFTE